MFVYLPLVVCINQCTREDRLYNVQGGVDPKLQGLNSIMSAYKVHIVCQHTRYILYVSIQGTYCMSAYKVHIVCQHSPTCTYLYYRCLNIFSVIHSTDRIEYSSKLNANIYNAI